MESPSISLAVPSLNSLSLHAFLLAGMAHKKVVVLWLGLHENDDREKEKQKVLKAVSTLPGLDLIAVDMKECKLTVVGLVDPIELVTKLRRHWRAEILSVGPAKHDTAAAEHHGGAGSVKEEGAVAVGSLEVAVAATAAKAAKQVVEGPGGADMRSWPHAAVHVYPPGPGARPRYPYPHHQYGGGHLAHPNSYGVAHGGHGGARGNYPNYPYAGRGYYGGQDPNGCTIC